MFLSFGERPSSAEDAGTGPGRSAWLAGFTVGLPASIGNLGLAAPTVVLPRATHDLGVAGSAGTWIVAGFTLGVAGSVAVGRLVDTRGSRATLGLASGALLLGSVACLVAPSLVTLVLARMVEGFGSASIAIVCFATIAARVQPAGRRSAYGALTSTGSLLAGAGPLFGAWTNGLAGWRPVMALPALALFATRPVWRAVVARAAPQQRVDVTTVALVLLVATALIALLEAGATRLPLSVAVGLGAVCGLAVTAVVWRARRIPDGLLPREILHNRELACLTLGAACIFGAYLGASVLFPVLVRRTSPLAVGVLLLPAAVVAAVAAHLVGRGEVAARRQLVVLGIASLGGILVAGASSGSPILVCLAGCLIISPWAGAQVIGLESVPRLVAADNQGVALGLFNFLFVVGGSLGAATAGAFLSLTGVMTATLLMGALPVLALLSAARLAG